MLTSASAVLVLASAPAFSAVSEDCDCHAVDARYNVVNQPKTGYDYVPVVEDDSLGFYVAYSAKQNDTNTDFVSTSCMYVLPLVDDEVLVFGGGFGDTWYIPGGAFFDADYDAAMVKEAIAGCMGRDLATTRVRFLAPHGHPDHITVAFVRALERAGLVLSEIAYHEGDRAWIEQLPWLAHHPDLFQVLRSAPCGREILAYESPLGPISVLHRPNHTAGSVDILLDVLGNPDDRILILGSAAGGCAPPEGVTLTLAAHGTAMVGGPRRAQVSSYNGQGVNRTCLSSVTPPKVGETWVVQFDVAAHPDATFVLLFGSGCPLSPGVLTTFGELLVDPRGVRPFSFVRPVYSGDKEYIGIDLPRDPALMGRTCYVQGSILGGKVELCNAQRLVIGF